MRRLALIPLLALALAGCGGSSSTKDELVWCFAPGEKVTAAKKAEYPDLHIPKSACDAVSGG